MEVKSISQKIFRTRSEKAQNCEKTQSNHTNPFGVNFKGNMINADVFQVSGANKIAEAAGKISSKLNLSKLRDAMNIGSINSYLSKRLDPVMNLGRKIKNSAVTTWNNINETMLKLGVGKGEDNKFKILIEFNQYGKESLKKKPLGEVEDIYKKLVNQYVTERAAA